MAGIEVVTVTVAEAKLYVTVVGCVTDEAWNEVDDFGCKFDDADSVEYAVGNFVVDGDCDWATFRKRKELVILCKKVLVRELVKNSSKEVNSDLQFDN